jgi:hypothetical protein
MFDKYVHTNVMFGNDDYPPYKYAKNEGECKQGMYGPS